MPRNPRKLLGWNKPHKGITFGYLLRGGYGTLDPRYLITRTGMGYGAEYFTVTRDGDILGQKGTIYLAKQFAEEDAQRITEQSARRNGRRPSAQEVWDAAAGQVPLAQVHAMAAAHRGEKAPRIEEVPARAWGGYTLAEMRAMRRNGRRTWKVAFHPAVGQSARLKQIVERWYGKLNTRTFVATFAAADDAENATNQAADWGIAGRDTRRAKPVEGRARRNGGRA
jgi:hypothetical protein